jgi:DNA-binding CsgD family transcriptional regulator
VLPYSLHALIALHRDDLTGAQRELAASEIEAAGAPWLGTELMALARARLLESAGDVTAALDTIAGAFDTTAAGTGMALFLPNLGIELARLAVAAGQPAHAAGVGTELRRVAALNPGVGSLEAAALQARGLLTSDTDALLAAVELLRGTGRTLETARAAEDAATTSESAVELLDEARKIYTRSGATRDLARVDATLRRLGVRRGIGGPRRRPTTGWEALTDTELKVVRLVSEHLTNAEVAERMFISRRTVQTHVSHALAKLGVATRRELAAEAVRRAGLRLRVEGGGEHTEQAEPAIEMTRRSAVDDDHT